MTERVLQVVRCVGRGGHGEVYLARTSLHGGPPVDVALKVLHAGLDPASQAAQRLLDEARLLGLLSHPAIPRVHDVITLDGRVALVAEFVPGADLDRCATGDPPIPARAVYQVISRIADTLDAVWRAHGLVHRDIKPSNVRVGPHGEVKLLDFGIAKAAGVPRVARTETNVVVGSFATMAPERIRQEGDRPAGDIYGLGCTLHEALTGTALLRKVTYRRQVQWSRDPAAHDEALRERLGDAPAVLRAMVAWDPEARPTAAEVAVACEDLAESAGGVGLRRWARTRPWGDPPALDGGLAGREVKISS